MSALAHVEPDAARAATRSDVRPLARMASAGMTYFLAATVRRGWLSPRLGRRQPCPAPVRGNADGLRWGETGGLGGILDGTGFDVAVVTAPGGEEPDAVLIKEADGIDQRVGEIAVLVPEPSQHHIGDVVVVFVDQILPDERLDALTEVMVDIIAVSDLLDDLPGLEPEPSGQIGLLDVRRILRQASSGTSCWCTAGSWTEPAGRASTTTSRPGLLEQPVPLMAVPSFLDPGSRHAPVLGPRHYQ